MAAIFKWRITVLEERAQFQRQVDKLQKAYDKALKEYNSTRRLESYFQAKNKTGRYRSLFFFLGRLKY